jgi:aspartyl-tRNA synthetase
MRGLTNLRDVIAFPKTNRAVSPMDECPSEVEPQLLDDLHIEVRKETAERP